MAKKATPRPKTTDKSKRSSSASSTSSRTNNSKTRSSSKSSSTSRGGTTRRTSGSKPSTRSSTPARKRTGVTLTPQQRALFGGTALVFLTAFIFLSLISPSQGVLTQGLHDGLGYLFGSLGPLVAFAVGAGGFYLILWGMDQPPQFSAARLSGIGLLFLAAEGLTTAVTLARANGISEPLAVAQAQLGGGLLGGLLVWAGDSTIGRTGFLFIISLVALLGVVLTLGVTRQHVSLWLARLRAAQAERAADADTAADEAALPDEPAPRRTRTRPTPAADAPAAPALPVAVAQLRERTDEERPTIVGADSAESPPTPDATPARSQPVPNAVPVTPPAAEPTPVIAGPRDKGNWKLPNMADMLEPGGDAEWSPVKIQEQSRIIEHTLESFGAPGKIVDISYGPTVTQFGVEPQYIPTRSGRAMKVKVSKIASLADDLTLALSAKSVRIQAPVPGKGYIGIEVPNPDKAMVSLRDVMESPAYGQIQSPLRIGLGQDVAGQSIAADLARMPHLLIAGATGSGKSVCVNSIIACLLMQNTPDDLRFVMVDPKRVELTGYNGIPHLAAPVVVDMDRVVGVLQWALREMDSRYQLFAALNTRNIVSYNKKAEREGKDRLPYIVIIIDELADLMMTAPEDSERAIARLAQMSRATGIHMILATQRPSVNVVTGIIKANFPARIAFAVASSTDSRVILDQVGAERLLGAGDMLLQRPDAPAPLRMQGCFVSDRELNSLIDYWRTARRFHLITAADARPHDSLIARSAESAPAETPPPAAAAPPEAAPPPRPATPPTVAPPPVPQSRPQPRPQAQPRPQPQPQPRPQPLLEELMQEAQDKAANPDRDELYEEAVAYVRQAKKASTSMLQRRFRIGYTRAARIIDMMEENGIIGPPTGTSKAREIADYGENLL